MAIVAAAALFTTRSRDTALAEGGSQLTRFVAGAEAGLNQSLLAIDVLLAGTDELLDLSNAQEAWIKPAETSRLLRNAARQNLMVHLVALVDATGHVVASSDSLAASLDLPPGFADAVLGQTVSTLVFSRPVVSFSSSERVIYFGRHIRLADGTKLMALAVVPASAIASVVLQGVDMPGLQVTLERGSGQLILGIPFNGLTAERDLQPAIEAVTAMGAVGAIQMPSRLTDTPALVAFRPALYPSLWIVASYPMEAVLADWRAERTAVLTVAGLFGLMVLLAGFAAAAYVKHITAAREVLADSKADLDQALGSMVSGFLLIDADKGVLQWNHKFEAMFPWLQGLMAEGLPFVDIARATALAQDPLASPEVHQRWVDKRLALQLAASKPHELKFPDGRSIEVVERQTPAGGFVITYNDVTALRRASVEIETLAFYDPLTGLPNRRLLLDRLSQANGAAIRSGYLGAVLFLDLDKFKAVNDTMGHEVGDELLKEVAQRIVQHVREADTVARLGGDEFVVLLPELSADPHQAALLAQAIGEKLINHLSMPYTLAGQFHRNACSIGATLFGQEPLAPAELLKQSDIAMYQVKARQGNGLCFFDPKMQSEITQRAQLEIDLRVALEGAQFELFYQPQVALGGRIVGAEVLLRWHHPTRGMVSPLDFIAVAEERELIIPIGLWVLQTACARLAAWRDTPALRDLQLSVNVSARQFRQADFAERVAQVIIQSGVPPTLIKLELTESLVLDNVEDCVDKMEALKALGVQFSLDDFGTGHSSLAYLTRLPLDQLKIDQSFVRHLGMRHNDGVIVQTIIGMARNLDLEVIAEGVETAAQRDLLDAHGCSLYQGYLFGRPTPVAEFERLVTSAAA